MEYRIVRGILFVSPGKEIDHFRAERIIRYTESLLRQQRFRTMVLIWRILFLWTVPVWG